MEQKNNKKVKYNKNCKRKYVKSENFVKLYEIDVILSRDGKSYKAYVPACTSQGVLNGLEHIIDYMKKYNEIKFDVFADPVV